MIADVFILEQGQTIPVKALFDTGATGGCICKSFWL
jgi:predicted aspartyl protease